MLYVSFRLCPKFETLSEERRGGVPKAAEWVLLKKVGLADVIRILNRQKSV
jgi:hypothetical protein